MPTASNSTATRRVSATSRTARPPRPKKITTAARRISGIASANASALKAAATTTTKVVAWLQPYRAEKTMARSVRHEVADAQP